MSPISQARALLGSVRRGVSWARRGETCRTYFDPFNPRELNPVLARRGVAPLAADPELAERGVDGAARFVLALYAGTRRLRRRFPDAFAEGCAGPFRRWCLALPLSAAAARHIDAAFAHAYGARPARVWEAHPDLRATLPFALTPFERGKFLDWLLTDGKGKYGLTDAEALWHLFELAADPSCGLARTYRWTPEWQRAAPDALTPDGWPRLKEYVGDQMGFVSRWLRRASPGPGVGWAESSRPTVPAPPSLSGKGVGGLGQRRNPSPNPSPKRGGEQSRRASHSPTHLTAGSPVGVNLLGYFGYTSGLQQVALATAEALRRAGVPTSLRDVPTPYLRGISSCGGMDGLEVHGTTVVNLPIDLRLGETARRAGLWLRPGVRRVAVPWWELERIPPELAAWASDFDGFLAPTRFIADAVRGVTDRPVRVVLPGLELPHVGPLPKERFGLDPAAFTFLFVFDFNSRMPRKNPLGLIRAFRAAFKKCEPAQLAIKVSAGDRRFDDDRRALREAAEREGVRLIDSVLTREELLGLMAACDCYVSLHRSEGFGLTVAEAMLLGKPAVATGYSGNLDFMTPENSRLVDFKLVPIAEDVPPYPRGYRWAEPCVEHAAAQLRWVYEHPAEAKALGERGREDLTRLLSLEAYGERLAEALRASQP